MSFAILETNYAKNNQETLRWASVAVAGFLALIALVWAALIWNSPTFKAITQKEADKNARIIGLLAIAFFFLMTVASTFLSWYTASLHMYKDNLIALDVLNIVTFFFLSFAAYMYFKQNPMKASARQMTVCAMTLQFVATAVLLISPTAAGLNGALTQSSLYMPFLVSSLVLFSNQL